MNLKKFYIKLAEDKDLTTIVRLHKEAYGRKHFTSLFSNALLKKYYQAFLSDQSSIKMTYSKDDNHAIGFSVYGKLIPKKLYEFQKNNFFGLIYTISSNPLDSIIILLKNLLLTLNIFIRVKI